MGVNRNHASHETVLEIILLLNSMLLGYHPVLGSLPKLTNPHGGRSPSPMPEVTCGMKRRTQSLGHWSSPEIFLTSAKLASFYSHRDGKTMKLPGCLGLGAGFPMNIQA